MATKISTIYTLITAKTDGLKKGLVSAHKASVKGASKIQKALNKINFRAIGLGAVAFGGVVGIAMKKAVDAASALEEATGKFNVVFRDQLKQAEAWAKDLVAGYGLSTREAKTYLAAIQDLLKPMGVASDAAARLSNEVVKLAVDLGSFNNQITPDVMRDIESALVGNYETMKKYGVVLNVAVIRQEALRTGMIRGKEVLTAAQKATAAYSLIVAGSADAVGDWARTSSGYANTMKQMGATIEEIAAKIGDPLMPAIADVVRDFNEWATSNQKFIDQDLPGYTKKVGEAVRGLADAFVYLSAAFDKLPGGSTAAAAGGIIGYRMFGNWGPAKILGAFVVFNELLKNFNMDVGSIVDKYKDLNDLTNKIIKDVGSALGIGERSEPLVLSFDMPDRFNLHVGAWEANREAVKKRKEEILKNNAAVAAAELAEKKLAEQLKKVNAEYVAALPTMKAYRDSWQVKGERTATDEQIDKANELNNAFESLQSKRINEALDDAFKGIGDDADAFKGIGDDAETTFTLMADLSERTAWAMQENFSDLFFDVMTGEFKSLNDYATAVLRSIQRGIADMMGQGLTQGIFGKEMKGGGWLSDLFSGGSTGSTGSTVATNVPTIRGGQGGGYGFQHGGYIGEPVKGFGMSSGKSYEFHPNEVVTPAGGGGVQVDVNVVNNLGQEADISQSSNWINPGKMVTDIILNKKLTSRGFRQVMRA